MGTILSSAIVDNAEMILHDSGNKNWAAADLFTLLCDGQREIARIVPDASVSCAAVICVSGVKQTITGKHLIKITDNMGTAGTTRGAPVTLVDMKVMDECYPGWTTVAASATAIHYMYDERYPQIFYVYPQQPGSAFGYLEITQATNPAAPATIATAITLGDEYAPVLMDYILYRAWLKDSAHSLYGRESALIAGNKFLEALGQKEAAELRNVPIK